MAGPASSFSHPPEPARLPRLRVMALSKHLLMVLLAAAALAGSRAQVVAPEVTVVQQTTALPLAGAPTQQVTFSEARPIVSVTAEPPCTTVLEVRLARACPSAAGNGCSRAALAPTRVRAPLRPRTRSPPHVWVTEHARQGCGCAFGPFVPWSHPHQ